MDIHRTETRAGLFFGLMLAVGCGAGKPTDAGSLAMGDALTGQYDDGDAGVPELHGTMILDSPQLATVTAAGTWTASLQ